MYKLLIIIAFIVVSKLLTSPSHDRTKSRRSAQGKEVEPGDLRQTLSELLMPATAPAKPQRRKRAKQIPPAHPVVDEMRGPAMTPASSDTTIRMRDYHSTLRPSEYILRRRQDEVEHLSHSAANAPEGCLGSELFDTEDRSRTLCDAILRAEILRRREV